MEVCAEQLGSFNVVAGVELLVDGVGHIGRAAHGQEKNVLAGGLLEGKGDWDTTGNGLVYLTLYWGLKGKRKK